MWQSNIYLNYLYRASVDNDYNFQRFVETGTNKISKIMHKRTDLPFTLEKLEEYHSVLLKRLELLIILSRFSEEYDNFLDGKQLSESIRKELDRHIIDSGPNEYSFLYGIRKKKSTQKFDNLDGYISSVKNDLRIFERYYSMFVKDKNLYEEILKEKKKNKNRQKRVMETQGLSDSEFDLEKLQMFSDALTLT